MRAAKIFSQKRFEIVDDEIPAICKDMVLVKLLRTAVCGSDLPYFSGSYDPSSYPFPSGYPGHECLGVVVESGSAGLKPDDHVMYYPVFLDGFKEYHLTDINRLQKIPESGDMNILIMTQLLGAVAHCVFRLDKPYNRNVVIMGQGPVGLLFTSLIKNAGAKSVIAVDPLNYRLEAAKKMGADHIVNPDSHDLVTAVSDLTDGAMADIVIDAYGQDSGVINNCFQLACHNGQVAFFGICLEESPRMDFNTLFRKELRMIASVGPNLSIDYPYALDMILRTVVDVRPIVTHVIPFEDIQKGFEMASNRQDNAIKVILKF